MIEAVITVISCDRCKKIVCLRTDEEYEEFEATWFDGIVYSFCPDCRIRLQPTAPLKAETLTQIELDRIF